MSQTLYIGRAPVYLPWPAPPKEPPADGWPPPPTWPTARFRVESMNYDWSGEIDVRDVLTTHFGEDRAVALTAWGMALVERREVLWQLFLRHPYADVRARFVKSLRWEKVD